MSKILGVLLLLLVAAPVMAQTASPQPSPTPQPSPKPSSFKSPEDGWFDLGGFLGKAYGFMPIAAPITEPAVGYGLAGGLAFISEPVGRVRPNITFVGGLGTENGTKGGVVGDLRYWYGRKLQTLAAVVYASVNLDFYGIGSDPALADHPLQYNLEPAAFLVEGKYRLGDSDVLVGVGYVFSHTNVRFDAPAATPGLPDFTTTSRVGGLTPSVTVDNRDNLFTPTRGTYVEGKFGIFREGLGGDASFERIQVVGIQYVPLPKRVFLGLRGDLATSSAETPFYLRPYIYMRGVPAIRYQGETMAQAELELRWQFWNRLSAVAFGGGGRTWTDIAGTSRGKSVGAGGLGVRYEIARAYGIHMGADFAYGPAGHAFYVQVGSAWAKP